MNEIASNIIAKLKAIPGKSKILTTVFIIGVLTGIGTFLMKQCIKWIGSFVSRWLHPDHVNYIFIVLPIVGFLLTWCFQHYLLKEDLAHYTASIRRDIKQNSYYLKFRSMFTSIIGCSMTIGMGGSAGAEGPSAYTGAAIASNCAQWFRLSDNWIKLLFSIGAGAGIAGIFKSPIGGALYTLEVIGMDMSILSIMMLLACCLVASSTAWALGGFDFDIKFVDYLPFDPKNCLWITLLGLFCGLYSVYYNYTKNLATILLAKINNAWIKGILAGGAVGVCIMIFPVLFGEGYGLVGRIINMQHTGYWLYSPFQNVISTPKFLLLVTAGILLVKGFLVGATLNGGGIAGDFTPTIFAGCLAGYLFGTAMNTFFHVNLPAENFALLGMAAVMSGAIKAPLMAIFIVAEMSNSFQFMAGFLVVSAISFFTVKFCNYIVRPLNVQNAKAD